MFFDFSNVFCSPSPAASTTADTHSTTTSALNYDQTDWGGTCDSGKSQSPIDLPHASDLTLNKTQNYFKIVNVNYGTLNRIELEIKENIKFMVNASLLGYIDVVKNGINYRFDAVDINFHFPSEHSINHHRGDIEIHIIHQKNTNVFASLNNNNTKLIDPDIKNNYLIVATIFSASGDVDNKDIKSFKIDRNGPVSKLDLSHYPPKNSEFYFYEGSHTTPSCSENVNWVINAKVENMSKSQMISFVKWLTEVYTLNGNSRNIQPKNNRKIYYQYYPLPTTVTANSFLIKTTCIISYFALLFIFM